MPQSTSGLQVSIEIVMCDSQSAANFIRHMPKMMKILEKSENAFIFVGHIIVADGTTDQLCAMWTGMFEKNKGINLLNPILDGGLQICPPAGFLNIAQKPLRLGS